MNQALSHGRNRPALIIIVLLAAYLLACKSENTPADSAMARTTSQQESVVHGCLSTALSLQNIAKYDSSNIHLRGCLESKHIRDVAFEATCLNEISFNLWKLGRFSEGFQVLDSVLAGRGRFSDVERHVLAVSHKNAGLHLTAAGDYGEALHHEKAALSLAQMDGVGPTVLKANIITNIANIHFHLGDHLLAEQGYRDAYRIQSAVLEPGHTDIARTLTNLGLVAVIKGDYRSAGLSYARADSIILSRPGRHQTPLLAESCYMQGIIWQKRQDLERAKGYLLRALQIWESLFGTDHPSVVRVYNSLGVVEKDRESYDAALAYYRKNLEIAQRIFGRTHRTFAYTHANLAEVYKLTGDYRQALHYLNESLRLFHLNYGSEHPNSARALYEMAEVFSLLGDAPSSRACFEQSRKILQRHDDLPGLLDLMNKFGRHLLRAGAIREALALYDEAIALAFPHSPESMLPEPTPSAISEVELLAVELLHGAGLSHASLANEARGGGAHRHSGIYPSHQAAALERYRQASRLVEAIRASYLTESARLSLGSRAEALYDEAMGIALTLHEATDDPTFVEEALRFAEHGKGMTLLAAMISVQSMSIGNIPDSLKEREFRLSADLQYYRARLEKVDEVQAAVSQERAALQQKVFELGRAYESLARRFEARYPKYYHLKYGYRVPSLEQLQKHLRTQNSSLIEYVVGPNQLTAFVVLADTVAVHAVMIDTLDRMIDACLEAIRERRQKSFRRHAAALHRILLAPITVQFDLERVIIIPHRRLNVLPFEMLLIPGEAASGNKDRYALHDLQISYAYSYAGLLFDERRNSQSAPRNTILGFGPARSE